MNILVTGAGGLIGSEAVDFYCKLNNNIYGIENNQREIFFGKEGSVNLRLNTLLNKYKNFKNFNIDIRDKKSIDQLFKSIKFDVIIHTAAQPSHDKAAAIPFDDFETNANGTLNLLESVRRTNKDCIFIHMSTNKVYGDRPNNINLKELDDRYEYDDPMFTNGISESLSIDQSMHSIFGSSKLAADIMVQEYGKYFNMPTVCLRGGCITGENHKGVALHGFLNYLVKCNKNSELYTIFGYKGKQVRDNIHSSDVIQFMNLFINNPKSGEVYNIGGGKDNSCSIMQSFKMIEAISNKKMYFSYKNENRKGDHICYYSDLTKIKKDYPKFKVTKDLNFIVESIYKIKDK